MTRLRCIVMAGVAALIAAACSACSAERADDTSSPLAGVTTEPAGPSAPRITVDTVGVVGDSITVGSEDAVVRGIEALGVQDVVVDAENGRRIVVEGAVGSGVQAVGEVAEARPDLWVVALGTNDVLTLPTVDEYALAIDTLLDEIPDDAPLVWVDVYVAADPRRSRQFNEALRNRLAARPGAVVADWASTADDDGVLSDGVHPSEAGIEMFAGVVSGAVSRVSG